MLVADKASTPEVPLDPAPVMRTETIFFIQLLENFHLTKKKLGSIPSKTVIEAYLETLDTQKTIFTEKQHQDFVKKYENILELLWRSGSLEPGFAIFEVQQRCLQARIRWVQQRLKMPFDFKSDQLFKPERKNKHFAENLIALDRYWEKRLQHEMLCEMLCSSSEKLDDLDPLSGKEAAKPNPPLLTEEEALKNEDKARETLISRYQDLEKLYHSLEAIDVQELYCNTLAQFYDPHTSFFSADSMAEFTKSLRNSLVGIGALLSEENGACTVKEVLPGGPAEQSHQLHAGDKILSVAQGNEAFVSIQGMKLRKSVKLIQGKKGTHVRLLIQPVDGDPSERKILDLVRDEIKLENKLAFAKVYHCLDSQYRLHCIGLIDLPTFYGQETGEGSTGPSLSQDVSELIEHLKQHHVEGIILDMRRNGGGLLTEAVKLSGLFLKNCPVVQSQDEGKQGLKLYADADHCVWDGPLMILTSRFSASASEIVAGALQLLGRALIFGDRTTHGKGSVQAMVEMDRLASLASFYNKLGTVKLTVQKWYLPNGLSTQLRGVHADLSLPSIYDCLPIGESDLPHALPWDAIAPMDYHRANQVKSCTWVRPGCINYLIQQQNRRKETLSVYDWYQKQVDIFSEKYRQNTYSLNLAQRIQKLNEEQRFREKMKAAESIFYVRPYERILLQAVKNKKEKDTKRIFDFFENEALNLMGDWLSFLGIHPLHWPLWTYAQSHRSGVNIWF